MKIKNLPRLIYAILLCEGAGVIGSVFTFSAIPTWFATLEKPVFAPPNYLFGPVWTILYAMMGVSLFLVWISKAKTKRSAENIFFVQLGLNAIWSILFFGLRNPGMAFFEIVALWIAIILTIKAFYKISKPAAYLLLPYLAWVSFASVLNFAIWVLNTSR